MKVLFFSLAGAGCLAAVLLLAELRREIANDRQRAEGAVSATIEKIGKIEPGRMSVEIITKAPAFPAAVRVLGTNPIHFRVESHTGWPEWMTYEYDSRTPERGIYQYPFRRE
jgi:hypothetical protein